MKNLILLLCAAMLFSCAGEKADDAIAPITEPAPTAQEVPAAPKTMLAAADYTKTPAGDFINTLKEHTTAGWVTIEKAPEKWITRTDVDELMKLVGSTDACAGVVLSTSNIIPPDNVQSTIGVEALMLIEGYRKGSYPAYLSSLDYAKALTPEPGTKKLVLKPSAQLISETETWYKTLR